MIVVAHKRTKEKTLNKEYGDCVIADTTSKAKGELRKLSPFYPHGNIPIPNSHKTAESVEGLWQGLKVFKGAGIDLQSFENRTGKNIKRTVRKFGVPQGHQYGINSSEILTYVEARIKIYLPAYKYVLEKHCGHIISRLLHASNSKTIVLLDYTTNGNVFDTTSPLSHACLVKAYAEGAYDELSNYNPLLDFQNKSSETSESIIEQDIYNLIMDNAMSSNEIVEAMKLKVSARELTRKLKKSKDITVIRGRPLKFKTSNRLLLFK